jgi:hypothetical protein
LRERNIPFVLNGAAAIAEVLDGALRFETVTVRLVNRIACDPKLIARHACLTTTAATATTIGVATHRAFLLRDLGDAPALSGTKWDGAFIVDVAAPISEKIDGSLGFETISVILVKLVALGPQLLTRLSGCLRGGQAREDGNN